MFTRYIRCSALLFLSIFVSAVFAEASFYLVVLGNFEKDHSETLCRQLSERGYPAFIVYGENYEVRIGPYDDRDKAETAVQELEQEERIITKIVLEEGFEHLDSVDEIGSEDLWKIVDESTRDYYADERVKKIVSLGIDLFGHPYKYGGESIGKGIDCSFFVQSIYKELGIKLPRTAREQIKKGKKIAQKDLRVGDLVFFEKTYFYKNKKGERKSYKQINHVGIYIGNDEFIHATVNVKHVTISRLSEKYFKKRYAGARRVLYD